MVHNIFLKKFFYIIALVCIGTQTIYATPITTITATPSPFALNAGNADNKALQYGGNYQANLDTTNFTTGIYAINLNGYAPPSLSISGSVNLLLGPVVDTSGHGNKLTLFVASGQNIELTGLTFTNGFTAATNDYSAIGELHFTGPGHITASSANLTLNSLFTNQSFADFIFNCSSVTITDPSIGNFNSIISYNNGLMMFQSNTPNIPTIFSNDWGQERNGTDFFYGYFNPQTPVIITSPTIGSSLLSPGYMNIGTSNNPTSATIMPTNKVDPFGSNIWSFIGNSLYYGAPNINTGNIGYTSGIYVSSINLLDFDSELILDSSNTQGAIIFDTPGGDLINGVGGGAPTWGILTLNAQNNALTLTTTSTMVVGGQNPFTRPNLISSAALKTLNINGDSNVTLDLSGYAKTLNLNNSGSQITFTSLANTLNGPLGSTINLHNNANLQNSINAHGLEINFNTFELTLSPNTSGDTIQLGSDLPIILNTTFNSTNASSGTGGHLLLSGTSTLDLSVATNIQVNLTTDGTLPSARREFSYKVIDSGASALIPSGVTPGFSISGTPNAYSTWHFDPGTYTLYTITDFSYLPRDIANAGASPNAVAFATELVNSRNSGNNNATSALIQITTNDPLKSTAALIASDMGDIATGEAGDIATLAATTRIINDENMLADSESAGVSAGCKPGKIYGAWISPFYQKAIQKPHGAETGYKLLNYGGTVGVDTKITDDTTLGIALTALRAHIDCSQTKIDSKANSNTGVLSFYGKTSATRNIFVSAIGSFGISKIKSKEKRSADPATIDYANTQYKSYFHTISLIGSKDYGFERWRNVLVTPILGLRYAHFKDDGYTETDSLILNTSVAKKSNYGIDGILGGKIQASYNLANGYTILPEASSFAYLNLKHKTATMRVSSNAFNNPVTLSGTKPSKAWYTLGTGVTAQKGQMEYALQYESGFDKKYTSHQVTVKIRVDF